MLEGFASDKLVVLEHFVDVDEGVTVLVDFLLAVHEVLLELSELLPGLSWQLPEKAGAKR
ncbi:unnamed protein product [Alternaria alternata]